MRVEVRNLGILERVEIDLKPMTIFVGPNNSGKTLLAYVLLAIFGQDGWSRYTRALAEKDVPDVYPPLEDAIQQLLDQGSATIDLLQFATEYAEIYINNLARYAREWLKEFMNVKKFSFEELEVNISLGETMASLLGNIMGYGLSRGLSVGQQGRSPLLSVQKRAGESRLYFFTAEKGLETLPANEIRNFLIGNTFVNIHSGFYFNTYAFPTERTTFISMLSQGQVQAKSIVTNDGLESEQTALASGGALSNFMQMVVTSLLTKTVDREAKINRTSVIAKYMQLAQILEKDILQGGVDYSPAELEILRELLFKPSEDVDLEMGVVSSMVKELAPLVLYLRYVAQPKEWLIIDEPEMNLHPEAQVRLTELLTMLVHANLSILFTTHSPYMVDHLINLMKAAEQEDKATLREKFFLHNADAFIPREQVAVYLFEKGMAKSILGEDGLINWGTFSRVSDRLNQIYFEM